MASRFPTDNPTCPMCLESPPVLKMLRSCRHVFCETCLSKHLKGLGPKTKVISCPTCLVESPLPVDGVSGLADYSVEGQEGAEQPKGSRDIQRCQCLFTKEYQTDIQSIVNLGDRFAVAYGQSREEVEGVDVYDMSGVQQQTFKTNTEGLLHLAVTPDKGTLVAVCDEGRVGPYTIRMFDPVSGYIRSTPQFQVEGRVQRFDVYDGRQFLILHGDRRNKVTVVDEDGSVVTEDVESPSHSISCGGGLVFISRGWQHVDVYELTSDRHLERIASQRFDHVLSVSATADGEVTVTCKRGERWGLRRATFRDNKFSQWKYKDIDSLPQWLVSVGGDYVVVAGGDNNNRTRIIRVFKEEV